MLNYGAMKTATPTPIATDLLHHPPSPTNGCRSCPNSGLCCLLYGPKEVWNKEVWNKVWNKEVWNKEVWNKEVWNKEVWNKVVWNKVWNKEVRVCPMGTEEQQKEGDGTEEKWMPGHTHQDTEPTLPSLPRNPLQRTARR
ncbi:hypothetical protein ACOMHN_052808 [Nucella lapillus]